MKVKAKINLYNNGEHTLIKNKEYELLKSFIDNNELYFVVNIGNNTYYSFNSEYFKVIENKYYKFAKIFLLCLGGILIGLTLGIVISLMYGSSVNTMLFIIFILLLMIFLSCLLY